MRKLTELCVRRPVLVATLVLAMIGASAFVGLGVSQYPNVEIPTVVVTVTNPGASAVEVETGVTEKIEAAVNGISGVHELKSISIGAVSQVSISFDLDKDGDLALQEVRDKLKLIAKELPATADPPIVERIGPYTQTLLRTALSAARSLSQLNESHG